MSEQLLELLKLCLLALLYLFLLRVVWAVASQLRAPAPSGVSAGPVRPLGAGDAVADRSVGATRRRAHRHQPPARLIMRSPPERAGTAYDLVDGLTLGRAPGNTMTLDDSYASQHHARVVRRADGWWFEDLGSTNGSRHNGDRVSAPVLLATSDRIQIGDTVIEVAG